jgi:hypothetical protein
MSTYINIGEDRSVEWNIVPLNIYLYGVEDPRNRPIFGSFKIKHALEERYRGTYLSGYDTPFARPAARAMARNGCRLSSAALTCSSWTHPSNRTAS